MPMRLMGQRLQKASAGLYPPGSRGKPPQGTPADQPAADVGAGALVGRKALAAHAGERPQLDNPGGFAELALPGLALLVGCDHLTYKEVGRAPVQVNSVCYPPATVPPVSLAVLAAHLHEHPLVNLYRVTGDGQPVKISDFLSRQRFHRVGVYAEFFRHFPVELPARRQPARPSCAGHRHRAQSCEQRLHRGRPRPARSPPRPTHDRAAARPSTPVRPSTPSPRRAPADSPTSPTREVQVRQLVAVGRTNGAIARALDVSPARSPNTSNASTASSTSPAAPPPSTTPPHDQVADQTDQRPARRQVRSQGSGVHAGSGPWWARPGAGVFLQVYARRDVRNAQCVLGESEGLREARLERCGMSDGGDPSDHATAARAVPPAEDR